jgi:hypothetical protein
MAGPNILMYFPWGRPDEQGEDRIRASLFPFINAE